MTVRLRDEKAEFAVISRATVEIIVNGYAFYPQAGHVRAGWGGRCKSHLDSTITETHDVGFTVAVHVAEQSRMLLDAPLPGIKSKRAGKHVGCRREATIRLTEGHGYSVNAETDDVCSSVSIDISQQTGMFLDPPLIVIASVCPQTEVFQYGGRVLALLGWMS